MRSGQTLVTHARAGNGAQNPIDDGEVAGDELLVDHHGVTLFAWRRRRHCALWKGSQNQTGLQRRYAFLVVAVLLHIQQLSGIQRWQKWGKHNEENQQQSFVGSHFNRREQWERGKLRKMGYCSCLRGEMGFRVWDKRFMKFSGCGRLFLYVEGAWGLSFRRLSQRERVERVWEFDKKKYMRVNWALAKISVWTPRGDWLRWGWAQPPAILSW